MSDNGTGEGGGNGSVYWQMTHGKRGNGNKIPLANPVTVTMSPSGVATAAVAAPPAGPVERGHVKVGDRVEGHDTTAVNQIGAPDHPGKFRVRLRFPKGYENSADGKTRALLQHACPIDGLDPNSVFLVVDVPAISREFDPKTQEWTGGVWEIYWEW